MTSSDLKCREFSVRNRHTRTRKISVMEAMADNRSGDNEGQRNPRRSRS